MSNKGQSLVVFVLILPIIFLLISLVFEIGNLLNTQSRFDSEVRSTIAYGLKHINDENIVNVLYNLLNKNLEGEKNIEVSNNTIKINLKYNSINLYKFLSKQKYNIDVTYVGYMENNKIIINKE